MAETRYLARAPITEALLDIQVSLPEETTVGVLEGYQALLGDRYREKHVRQAFQSRFEMSANGPPRVETSRGGPDGFLFKAASGLHVVQARLDGFSFSRLKPYQGWEKFNSEAQCLWGLYVDLAKPERIRRIALRYINRITLPLPVADFKDYFLTTPEVAPGIPQGLAQFLMRLVIPHDESQSVAVVTEAIEGPLSPSETAVLPFILDIDVFRMVDWEPGTAELWPTIEQLRGLKNDIFFKSITERTVEMLQ